MDVEKAGEQVLILGAGQTGVELGVWLSGLGKKVTILSRSKNFMKGAYHNTAAMARLLLARDGAALLFDVSVDSIEPDGVNITRSSGERAKLYADTAVLATGFRADRDLYGQLRETVPQLYLIGDAAGPQNVYHAIHSAYEAASTL